MHSYLDYKQSPVLLPTVSDEPRTDFESVKAYFDAFLLKKPQGKILDGKITIGDGWASDSGIYEVCLFIFYSKICSYKMICAIFDHINELSLLTYMQLMFAHMICPTFLLSSLLYSYFMFTPCTLRLLICFMY